MEGTKPSEKRNSVQNRLGFLLCLAALLGFGSCTRVQPQASVQSRQAQPTMSPSQEWNPDCPSTGSKAGTTDHKVTLTWNASASASSGAEIRYCIYRSRGTRVQAITGKAGTSQVPCTNCELVNQDKKAVKDLFYQDKQVKNDSKYCYAAVAMQKGNPYFSEFSKQVEAEIPQSPAPIPPYVSTDHLCDDPIPTPKAMKTKVQR